MRLAPKQDCDFFDLYTEVISEIALLKFWLNEETNKKRRIAIKKAIVHMERAENANL